MRPGAFWGLCLSCLLPAVSAGAEWQFSADHRVAAADADDLENTHNVQPWGVDTVTGATRKVEQKVLLLETNVTAAYVENAVARVVGLRYLGSWGRETPYTQLRLSNLILAWHGEVGSVEAGYILTPSSWARGLLVDRLRFSGGRARIHWGASGRTEAWWTDTVEDPTRLRYYEISLAGLHHRATFPGGEAGLSVLDTSRDHIDVFPKQNCARGTFSGLDFTYALRNDLRISSEVAYGRLLPEGAGETYAGTAALDWRLATRLSLIVTGAYLAPGFNPLTGFYNVTGEENGQVRIHFPWQLRELGLRIRPSLGWKQQYAENFLVPSLEFNWLWTEADLRLRVYEYAEQPAARWGAEDHWEYTGASLTWQALTSIFVTSRWEKIYNGFTHSKSVQLTGEVRVKY